MALTDAEVRALIESSGQSPFEILSEPRGFNKTINAQKRIDGASKALQFAERELASNPNNQQQFFTNLLGIPGQEQRGSQGLANLREQDARRKRIGNVGEVIGAPTREGVFPDPGGTGILGDLQRFNQRPNQPGSAQVTPIQELLAQRAGSQFNPIQQARADEITLMSFLAPKEKKSPWTNINVDNEGNAYGFNTETETLEKIPQTIKPKKAGGLTFETNPDGSVKFSMGGAGSASKPTQTNIERRLLDATNTLSLVTEIENKFKPEFQQVGTRFNNALTALKDKGNFTISAQEASQLQEFTDFRANAAQNFSLTLKELSGVAVNPTEFKRAEVWLPNPGTGLFDGDSPIEMQTKIKRFKEFTQKAIMKYHYITKNGLSIDKVDVDDMPRIMNKRGRKLEHELRKQGLKGKELTNAVKQQLADEFGLISR